MSQEIAADAAAHPAPEQLEQGRAFVLRGDLARAIAAFRRGLLADPASLDLKHALAAALSQAGEVAEAESLLREVLAVDAGHVASAFQLARLLMAQGRMLAAETCMRALSAPPLDTGTLILAVELLDDCGRKQAAFDLVESGIVASPDDARLHAYAGMLAMQLGEFERARSRYRYAIDHDARAVG